MNSSGISKLPMILLHARRIIGSLEMLDFEI